MAVNPPQDTGVPSKRKRSSVILIFLIAIISAVPTGVCSLLFLGKFYGALAAVLFFLAFLGWFLKIRKGGPGELDRQIDKAMGEPSNDPRQMARWIR